MKLYDCKVRLAGQVANEVRKYKVTAAEIEILRSIHGADAVAEIVDAGEDKRTSAAERQRLYGLYASPNDHTPEQVAKKLEGFRALFGHDRMALPESLEELAPEVEDGVEAAPAPKVEKERAPAFAE